MPKSTRDPLQIGGEIEKGLKHLIVEIIEYIPNAVVSRTVIKKTTGNITAMSFDEGEEIGDRKVPYDTYIQIIDGEANIVIDYITHHLKLGDGIVIPANHIHSFNADEQFKLISTVIKNGFENQKILPKIV